MRWHFDVSLEENASTCGAFAFCVSAIKIEIPVVTLFGFSFCLTYNLYKNINNFTPLFSEYSESKNDDSKITKQNKTKNDK